MSSVIEQQPSTVIEQQPSTHARQIPTLTQQQTPTLTEQPHRLHVVVSFTLKNMLSKPFDVDPTTTVQALWEMYMEKEENRTELAHFVLTHDDRVLDPNSTLEDCQLEEPVELVLKENITTPVEAPKPPIEVVNAVTGKTTTLTEYDDAAVALKECVLVTLRAFH